MADNHLDDHEAKRVVDAAYAEFDFDVAKELRDLYDRVNTEPPKTYVGVGPEWRFPRTAPTGTADFGARWRLYYALDAGSVPIPDGGQLQTLIAMASGWRAKKSCAPPPSTARMFELTGKEHQVSAHSIDPAMPRGTSATRQV